MRLRVLVGMAALGGLLTGCKGADGATGPQGVAGAAGAQGLPGPAGPGTRVVLVSTVNSNGGATGILPAAAGNSIANPPAMACYLTSPGGTAYLAIAGTSSSTNAYCGLGLANGVFVAVMNQAPPGWTAVFVIVY